MELSSLKLDEHARKKMIKLVGERYCKDTDVLTITTDRYAHLPQYAVNQSWEIKTLPCVSLPHFTSCPLRKQNKDYAMYLLTVLYHESWVSRNRVFFFLLKFCHQCSKHESGDLFHLILFFASFGFKLEQRKDWKSFRLLHQKYTKYKKNTEL